MGTDWLAWLICPRLNDSPCYCDSQAYASCFALNTEGELGSSEPVRGLRKIKCWLHIVVHWVVDASTTSHTLTDCDTHTSLPTQFQNSSFSTALLFQLQLKVQSLHPQREITQVFIKILFLALKPGVGLWVMSIPFTWSPFTAWQFQNINLKRHMVWLFV